MSYDVGAKRKVLKLVFEDPDMDGLVVRARSTSLGGLVKMVRFAGLDGRELKVEDLEALSVLFETFAKSLVDWNITEDGVPIPATLDGLYSLDQEFALTIIGAWQRAIAGVSGPLGPTSNGGGQSVEASIPMAPYSASQAS